MKKLTKSSLKNFFNSLPDLSERDKKQIEEFVNKSDGTKKDIRSRLIYMKIIYTVGAVHDSAWSLTTPPPATYLDALRAFPKGDQEARDILGQDPAIVAKMVEIGALGLNQIFLNGLYETYRPSPSSTKSGNSSNNGFRLSEI